MLRGLFFEFTKVGRARIRDAELEADLEPYRSYVARSLECDDMTGTALATRGRSVGREAQMMAQLSSMTDQMAAPTLSQDGSELSTASRRVHIR